MKRNHRRDRANGIVLGASLVVLTQATCLVLDEDHCLSNGGDFACGGSECVMQTGPTEKTMSNDVGCAFFGYDTVHLPLPFGLPAELESRNNGVDDLDSLEGVLEELVEEHDIEDVCKVDDAIEDLAGSHANIQIIRNRHDSWEYVRKKQTQLSQAEVDAVKAYNAAVTSWLVDCRARARAADSGV